MFTPFLVVFNICIFLVEKDKKLMKISGLILLVFISFKLFMEKAGYMETICNLEDIDKRLKSIISENDYVLFENSAQLNPTLNEESYTYGIYNHHLTYLQKYLGVKFFSQPGNDAHPYNKLRNMYITNGYYKGRKLNKDIEKEFISLLKEWGVNKVCVWSDTSKEFFDNCEDFSILAESEKYICYEATYKVVPEIIMNGDGHIEIYDEGPFFFKVRVDDINGKRMVRINKNYFDFWCAYEEKGSKINLKQCDQRICFYIDHPGEITFRYKKNILMNLISVLPLIIYIPFDIKRVKIK